MGRSVWRDAVLFRWALLPLVLGACGDDGGGAPPSEPITRPDGGGSKPDDDAGLPDGGEEDEDAARPDGDGGVDDDDGGFTSECEGNLTTFPAAKAAGPAFSSSVRGNELTLVYLEASCGGTRAQNYAQGLMLTTLATTGDAATPSALVNVGENICYVTRNPALIAQADDDIALFYTSNSEGTNELFFTQGSGSARQTVAAGFNEFSLAAAHDFGRSQ